MIHTFFKSGDTPRGVSSYPPPTKPFGLRRYPGKRFSLPVLFEFTENMLHYRYEEEQNTKSVVDIYGGKLEIDGRIRFGDQRGSETSPMTATLNLYDGVFLHPHATEGIRFGHRSPAANGTINIHGGLFDEGADLMMGMNASTSHLNLHGGVLRMRNITASTGDEYLYLNGGTIQPRLDGYTLSGLTAATVSTNGVVFDTSLAS